MAAGSISQTQVYNPSSYLDMIRYGNQVGKETFYDDPDMQNMRARREDLSKGYSGEEMGALRTTARNEIRGQQGSYMNQLRSNMARSGVGGARAAAMSGAANQKFAGQTADAERKMALDSAQMKRQGVNDLQDYLFRQKFGQLGTGLGYGQMGASQYAADAMRGAAGQGGGGGSPVFDGLLGSWIGGMGMGPIGSGLGFASGSGYDPKKGLGVNIGGISF